MLTTRTQTARAAEMLNNRNLSHVEKWVKAPPLEFPDESLDFEKGYNAAKEDALHWLLKDRDALAQRAQPKLDAESVAQAFRQQSPEHERLYVEAEARAEARKAQSLTDELVEAAFVTRWEHLNGGASHREKHRERAWFKDGFLTRDRMAQQAQPRDFVSNTHSIASYSDEDTVLVECAECGLKLPVADAVVTPLVFADGVSQQAPPEPEDDSLEDRMSDFLRFAKRRSTFVHDRAEHLDVYLATDVEQYFGEEIEATKKQYPESRIDCYDD